MINLVPYALLCLLLAGSGVRLLRLIGLRLEPGLALLLGPPLAQAVLACVLGLTVVAGVPIKQAAIPIWIGLALLTIIEGISWVRHPPRLDRQTLALLAVVVLTAPLVMLPYFVHGLADYPGSGLLDGWSYVAFGQYLWEMPRDTNGGLAPLFQYASHLSHTRYVAATTLGVLSGLYAPGDLQAASGLLQASALFTFACACAAFVRVRGVATPFAQAYVAVAGISGWALDVVWANNFDNALALVYVPAFAALVALPAASVSQAIVGGIMAAGAVYTYPEMAVLILGCAGLLQLETVWRQPAPGWVRRTLIAIAVAIVLVAPYWPDVTRFFLNQARFGMSEVVVRPGAGMFPGLISARYVVSSVVALGGEQLIAPHLALRTLAAIFLLIGIALGWWQGFRKGDWVWSGILGFSLAGAAWFIIRERYDYGAYKLLLFGWWATAFAIVLASQWLIETFRRRRLLVWLVAAGLVSIVPAITVRRAVGFALRPPPSPMRDYRALERVPDLIGAAPVVLMSAEIQRTHWATYFLRDSNLILPVRNGYLGMTHLEGLINNSRAQAPAGVRFVLADANLPGTGVQPNGWSLIWGNNTYGLWDTGAFGWLAVSRVHDAFGQLVMPQPQFRLGPRPSRIDLLASRPGVAVVSAILVNETNEKSRACWHLALTPPGGVPQELYLRPGPMIFRWPVPVGASSVLVSVTPGEAGESGRAQKAAGLARLAFEFHASDTPGALDQTQIGRADYQACPAP